MKQKQLDPISKLLSTSNDLHVVLNVQHEPGVIQTVNIRELFFFKELSNPDLKKETLSRQAQLVLKARYFGDLPLKLRLEYRLMEIAANLKGNLKATDWKYELI